MLAELLTEELGPNFILEPIIPWGSGQPVRPDAVFPYGKVMVEHKGYGTRNSRAKQQASHYIAEAASAFGETGFWLGVAIHKERLFHRLFCDGIPIRTSDWEEAQPGTLSRHAPGDLDKPLSDKVVELWTAKKKRARDAAWWRDYYHKNREHILARQKRYYQQKRVV